MAGQKRNAGRSGGRDVFTDEERAAIKELARERKAAGKSDGEAEVREKIAAMANDDRAIAERIHAIVKSVAPDLTPRTWYGMPAYARDGNVLCFFQDAAKFKARYATLGFSDKAKLDAGDIWPTSFAIVTLSPAAEKQIEALIRQATS